MVDPGYLAVALPKLNVVIISKLLSLFHRLGVVGAFQLNRVKEVPVGTYHVNTVFGHGQHRWMPRRCGDGPKPKLR
jgi:hypothetical protein